MTFELRSPDDCVFCEIVAGNAEASWEVRPDAGTTVVCFHNQLKWERVMLLIVPIRHMTQKEFWSSQVLVDAASLAVNMGDKHCANDGFRVISNFGRVAHQSQAHAHMHVVSGTSLQAEAATLTSQGSLAQGAHDVGSGGLLIDEYEVDEVPFAVEVSPSTSTTASPVTQRDFWDSEQILDASKAALSIGGRYSAEGYRLMSTFDPASDDAGTNNMPGLNDAGLFLLGGGQLGLYV